MVAEAATRAGAMSSLPMLGRPTCMALPAALANGTVTSAGCIGNRVYTGVGEDELFVTLRGSDLERIVAEMETIVGQPGASDLSRGDGSVAEVGRGAGALTERLAQYFQVSLVVVKVRRDAQPAVPRRYQYPPLPQRARQFAGVPARQDCRHDLRFVRVHFRTQAAQHRSGPSRKFQYPRFDRRRADL